MSTGTSTPRVVPGWIHNTAAFLIFALAAAGLGVGGFLAYQQFHGPAPAPPPSPCDPVDPAFVALGKRYRGELAAAYATAWLGGAAALQAGQSFSAALATVGKSWDSGRSVVFDRVATPEFGKIIPPGTADSDITPAQKAKMEAAWRGFAAGLTAK